MLRRCLRAVGQSTVEVGGLGRTAAESSTGGRSCGGRFSYRGMSTNGVATKSRFKFRHTLRQNVAAAPKTGHAQLDSHMLERAAAKLLRQPAQAAEIMAKLPIEDRRNVALAWALTEIEEEFIKADKDKDGKLTYEEFRQWAFTTMMTGPKRDVAREPSRHQLLCVATVSLVPFVGFGMVDNGLMVIFGDVIDGTVGVLFGCSMLASAALGNAISNVFGMLLHGTITKGADKLGLPDARLTLAQRKLPSVHAWSTAGSTLGVFLGCLLGMLPLLFMDQTKKEEERAHSKVHHEE
eukprot:TRINITY_DN29235_c0_g1_i1.p1 TRINITY_DN29235_c0_g1~~TRINITY_DN29235_c0_g1_i1.p1  ORF type:complete len:313 (-),score=61.15 TRINITY_DN29235_c0_g1_i1:242-1123(-)